MRRLQRKPEGWEHLFEVPGYRWEVQTDGLKALHVDLGHKHVVVYAYHKAAEFNVVTYLKDHYTGGDDEQWLGPMEALCVVLEALKEASTPPTSKPGT